LNLKTWVTAYYGSDVKEVRFLANLKIFISSTCYDLSIVRSQLRGFILGLGYEPVMSDFSDVLYDPRAHTHTSCVQEVTNCDMLILIIGSRFGGTAIPKAIDEVDIIKLMNKSKSKKIFENPNKLSITQLEVLKAIEYNIPIFTFIDSKVYHDHLVYENNKGKGMADKITYPSIDKQETAIYIFEFINFLRLSVENNNISEFMRMEEIETFLRKQWSGLLQRLLYEQRSKKTEERKRISVRYIEEPRKNYSEERYLGVVFTELDRMITNAKKEILVVASIHSNGKPHSTLAHTTRVRYFNTIEQVIKNNANQGFKYVRINQLPTVVHDPTGYFDPTTLEHFKRVNVIDETISGTSNPIIAIMQIPTQRLVDFIIIDQKQLLIRVDGIDNCGNPFVSGAFILEDKQGDLMKSFLDLFNNFERFAQPLLNIR